MNFPNPLPIQLCQRIVQISCLDEKIHHLLGRCYRHCLCPAEQLSACEVVARYRIEPPTLENENWLVWRDEKLIHHAPDIWLIFMYFAREVPPKLVTRCHEQFVFHSAGLVYQNKGIFLPGESGSGKSTLTAWLTAHGFGYLSDEWAALKIEATSTTMGGLSYPLILRQGSEFVWRQWVHDSSKAFEEQFVYFFDGAAWLDPESFRQNSVHHGSVPARIIIFPQYQPNQPLTSRLMSSAEVVFKLMPRLINFANFPDRGLAKISQLARQLKSYHLSYGDISAATAWIKETMAHLEDSV